MPFVDAVVDVVVRILMEGEDQLEIPNDHVEYYLAVILLQMWKKKKMMKLMEN
jgi:hypothetical protein